MSKEESMSGEGVGTLNNGKRDTHKELGRNLEIRG